MPKRTSPVSDAVHRERKERRNKYPAPAWADHVLHGIEGRTSAQPLTASATPKAA